MKRSKKFIAGIFSVALAFSLIGCGGKSPENSTKPASNGGDKPYAGKTLKFAGLEGGYGVEGWKKVISKFEEKTGAKVEATFAKNIVEEVRPQITAGNAPDVMYISLGQKEALIETMLKEKAVLDISDVLNMKVFGEEKTVKEKIIPGMFDTYTTAPYGDGKTYLMPVFYSPTGLFYNKALFKNGGGELELPKTIDEMLALKGKVQGSSVMTYPVAGYLDQVLYGFINEVGGPELFNKMMSYDVEAWKTQAKPVFEAIGKLISDLYPNTVSQANKENFTKNQLAVMKNEALFMPNGSWIENEMKDAKDVAPGFKWGFMALPAIKDGGDRYAYTFTEQVWVSKDTKEAELAKTFISYLYSDEAVKLFVENGGAVVPTTNATTMIKDESQKQIYSVYDGGVKPALGNFQAAPAVEGLNLKKLIFDTIDSVANKDKTVDQWYQEVVDGIVKISEAKKAE